MKKKHLFGLTLFAALILAGQIVFRLVSDDFTMPRYESRVYATTGIQHDSSDLHKLNEAAHYFGQTMIGWTKFPHFMSKLQLAANLPQESSISAHIQERQNIIFTVHTSTPLPPEKLTAVKDFIQGQIDEYNALSRTEFVLSNLDYEHIKIQRSYRFGALAALAISFITGLGVLFIKKEF